MSVADNISDIREKMGDSSAVLIAVSKMQSEVRVREALEAGQRVFGENRVQEAQERWSELKARQDDLELHLIGNLQTNKVKEAVSLFDVIHTVDRSRLARKLSDEMEKQGRRLPCLVQVNTGEEDQKAGVAVEALPDFLNYCRNECGLDIRGLMCIPPVEEPAALHFALLRKLAGRHGLAELSMGMSSDFGKALDLGATMIRVGTGVFGERD